MRVSTGRENAVDILDANAATSVAKVEPRNSSSTIRAGIGAGRGIDGCEFLSEEDISAEMKGRRSVGVEEMVANKGNGSHAAEFERGALGEGMIRVRTYAAGDHSKGHVVAIESLRTELDPFPGFERPATLAGVQVGNVIEHCQSTNGRGIRVDIGASVILDAKAEDDACEAYTGRRRR